MAPTATPRRSGAAAAAATPKESSTYSMLCQREILYHGFLCCSAIGVTITQATILNFYIIAYFRGYQHHVASYFWFLGDLFIVCLLAISFTTAYRYIHLRKKLEDRRSYSESQIQQKVLRSIYKHVMWLSPRYCGTLPFSFLSWFLYSSYLVGKIAVIFTSEIPTAINSNANKEVSLSVDPINALGSNLLKVTIGLSALVFIIMLQAHHNHDEATPQSGYITGICHNMAVEVFDSVTLLGLLLGQDKGSQLQKMQSLSQLIIALSSVNLILPTATFFSLSMSDFGRHLEKVISIKVASQLVHLLVINIPFLGVRIYLWTAFNYELSLFVVKNLCYIFMLCHSLYPGFEYILGRMCRSRSEALLPTETNASGQFSSDNSEEMMEMTARAVSNGSSVPDLPRD